MAIAADDTILGSLSGDCVEGTVVELSREVMRTGVPLLESFGESDEAAYSAGLTCGGTIEVLVQVLSVRALDGLRAMAEAVQRGEQVVYAMAAGGGTRHTGSFIVQLHDGSQLGDTDDVEVSSLLNAQLLPLAAPSQTVRLGTLRALVQRVQTSPRLIICDASSIAAALAKLGKLLGYSVTLCDARPIFTTKERFPDADEVVVDWPHRYLLSTDVDERSLLCVLNHAEVRDTDTRSRFHFTFRVHRRDGL